MSTIGTFCTDIVYDDGDFKELQATIKNVAKSGGWVVRKLPEVNVLAGKSKGMYNGCLGVTMCSIAGNLSKRLKNPIIISMIEEERCKIIELSSKEEFGYREIFDSK